MHEKTAYHALGSISASSGRHSESIGDLRYYAALSPNDSAKVQEDYEKATMGFNIISGLTLSYSTSFPSAFLPHVNKLKAKIYFFLLSLCTHILNAQKLLIQKKKRKINMHLNLVYVSQLHPQICIRAGPNDCRRWRRHGSLTASFYAGSVCVCVHVCALVRLCACVRPEEQSQKTPSAWARFFTHHCLRILLGQLCVHCALLCYTTPTDDLEICRY